MANGGPYVQVAVLCETFIKGAQSGNLSLINLIEGMTIVGTDDEIPSLKIGPPLKLVIGLWAGTTRGRYPLSLRPEAPSGLQGELIKLPPVHFRGAMGADTILPMPEYEITEEGTTWFDVLFSPGGDEDDLLTRIPFSVAYMQQ